MSSVLIKTNLSQKKATEHHWEAKYSLSFHAKKILCKAFTVYKLIIQLFITKLKTLLLSFKTQVELW